MLSQRLDWQRHFGAMCRAVRGCGAGRYGRGLRGPSSVRAMLSRNPQHVEHARGAIRESLLRRAEAQPEPAMPRPPSPVPPRRVEIILEHAWYHCLPIWMWDIKDHEAMKRKANEMAAEMRQEFDAKGKACEQGAADACKLALEL